LLRPAQARLNFGLRFCSPCSPLLTAPWRSQDPSHYKLSTFKGQGFPKMGPLHIHNLCLPKLHPGTLSCLSTRKFPFSLCICLTLRVLCVWLAKVPTNSPCPSHLPNGVLSLPSHLLSLLISIYSNTLSSHGLIFTGISPLHPLARHLLEFLLPLPNSAIDFRTFRNHPP
jgi:hypothetical protein